MRISTNYIYNNTTRIMQQSISNLLKSQEIMATQKRINHISDDPVDMGRILDTRSMVAQNDQFIRNLDTANSIAELYDGSLDSAISLLERAKELLLDETSSATSTELTREAARTEIVSLASQLVSIGNLQYGDRFLYAGFLDDTAPFIDLSAAAAPDAGNTGGAAVSQQAIFDPAAVTGDDYEVVFAVPPGTWTVNNLTTGALNVASGTYTSGEEIQFDGITVIVEDSPGPPANGDRWTVSTTPAGQYVGDNGVIELEIEQDVWERINLIGDEVFRGAGGGVDVFDLFEQANEALRNNDQVALNALLQDFDDAAEQLGRFQAQIGARENLYSNTKDRVLDVQMRLEILQSELEDVDVTEAVTELNQRENAYQAVLSATAKVLQPNLLDFLR